MRLFALALALVGALLLAAAASRTPAPLPADAPDGAFSAGRAMADIEQIARAPHPTGSPEHARVRAYLLDRMVELGLQIRTQTGPLTERGASRLSSWTDQPNAPELVNLIGVLPGRDRTAPAVLLMSHYDTVPGSPGAADDSAGVAVSLETVRALKSRGQPQRDLIVLITDAEELNLDGARLFFAEDPLANRIGAVVNMEARGGGGRAMMFETGRNNGEMIRLFGRVAPNPTANSLASFVYEAMPNGTDFTVPREADLPGLNLAFIGRPDQYHAPTSTPAALDRGAVQHMGAQVLAATEALARAQTLPAAGEDRVYSDLLGAVFIHYPPVLGWGLIGLAALLGAFAAWRARRAGALRLSETLWSGLWGVWLVAAGLVLAALVRAAGGPPVNRATSAETYYVLLRRLPWIEVGVGLALLGAVLVLLAGGAGRRWIVPAALALSAVAATALMGFDPVTVGAAVLAAGLALVLGGRQTGPWGGWLGLLALVFVLACAAQAAAPEAAVLLILPLLLGAAAAAVCAALDPTFSRPSPLVAAVAAAIVGGALLLYGAHPMFLGVGMDLPGVMALIALLVAALIRPLAPEARLARPLMAAAGIALMLGLATAGAARLIEPTQTEEPAR